RYSMTFLSLQASPTSRAGLVRHAGSSYYFRGQDLNLRPPGYEPGELPLLHPGIDFYLPQAPLAGRLGGRCPPSCSGSRSSRGLGFASAVAFENPRRGEFAQLMANHVLGHIQPGELAAVVHQEGAANEFRHNGAIARPRLQGFTPAGPLLF